MRIYEKGKFYEFAVNSIAEFNNRKYISLSDGYRHTYRVAPFDFQVEWEVSLLPAVMRCYVVDLNINGLPYLLQSKEDALRACYTEPNTYTFKILAIKTDENTDSRYIHLNDSYGFSHRIYSEAFLDDSFIGEQIELFVKDIIVKENNKAYLDLDIPKENSEHKEAVPAELDVKDPREESKFGFENNEVEFKSTIAFPAGDTINDIDKQIEIIIQTIAGFQNFNGGKLYIGVDDSGNVCGINHDYKYLNTSENDKFTYSEDKDGFELKIRNTVKWKLGSISNSLIDIKFDKDDGLDYCVVDVKHSLNPIFLYPNRLYQRAGNMTQLLKGDEITFFIEERYRKRNRLAKSPMRNIEVEEEEEVVETTVEAKSSETDIQNRNVIQTIKENEIETLNPWKFLTLYKNGDWSFQNNKVLSDDIEKEIQIPKEYKKGYLVMAYDNGRVNVVSINDLLNPKRKNNRRKLRTQKKRYQTGWNTEARFINIFLANEKDLIVFTSTTKDGAQWVKIHHLRAISVHGIDALGNVLINDRINDAEINSCKRLSLNYHHLISGLILKDHQTSGYLGYRKTDPNFKKPITTLNRILAE